MKTIDLMVLRIHGKVINYFNILNDSTYITIIINNDLLTKEERTRFIIENKIEEFEIIDDDIVLNEEAQYLTFSNDFISIKKEKVELLFKKN
jgi:hypothetical protein